MIRFTLRITKTINDGLNSLKDKLKISKNEIINQAVKEFLKNNK